MSTMKNAVIIGAGQTGRGFIAPIVENNSYHLTFVDKDAELIEKMNQEKQYVINYFGETNKRRIIKNFDAFQINDENTVYKMAEADVIFVSVFASHIAELIPYFKRAAELRENGKMTVFCCENGVNVKKPLVEAGIDAIISEGIIFCTTLKPDKEKLDLISQDYPELPVDGKISELNIMLDGMPHEMDFPSLIQRKIYTYNFVSAIVAYLGSYKGYSEYGEAANDEEISHVINQIVPVISDVIAKEYNISYDTQLQFTNRAVEKFKNREIYDTIYRNARQAQRKLGPNERLLTPLRLAYKYQADLRYISLVIAAALDYGVVQENMVLEEIWDNINKIVDETEIKMLYQMFREKKPLSEILQNIDK